MRQPSTIKVAQRWFEAKRAFYFHGTTADRLRQILKIGLLPAGWKGVRLVYDEAAEASVGGLSKTTFGGVYLTRSMDTAEEYAYKAKEGGDTHEVLVMVTLESRSPGVLLDEDVLVSVVKDVIPLEYTFDLFRDSYKNPFADLLLPLKSKARGSDMLYVAKYPEAVRTIESMNLSRDAMIIKLKLIAEFPKAERPIRRQEAKVEAAIIHLLKRQAIYLLSQGFDKDHKRSKKPPELRGAYEAWKDAIVALSRLIVGAVDESKEDWAAKIRYPRPITYRGKNRILCVVEYVHYYNEAADNETMTYKVWYGLEHYKAIVDPVKKVYRPRGSTAGYRVIDRSGRVLEQEATEGAVFAG